MCWILDSEFWILPLWNLEMHFSEWILDLLFSGILDSKSWILDSKFHKPFWNPDYLTWVESFSGLLSLSHFNQANYIKLLTSKIVSKLCDLFVSSFFTAKLTARIADIVEVPYSFWISPSEIRTFISSHNPQPYHFPSLPSCRNFRAHMLTMQCFV